MQNTNVKDLMASDLMFIDPEDTLREAAQQMKEVDCGVLPVGDKDDVEGIITDRDIVIRAIARGENPEEKKLRII